MSYRVRALLHSAGAIAVCACSSSNTPTAIQTRDAVAAAAADSGFPFVTAHASALPDLDDPSLAVAALNDFAEIVGTWSQNQSLPQAFKYQTTRGLTFLPHSDLQDQTGAWAVNNRGQIAVSGVGPDFGSGIGIWAWNGNLTFLRPLTTFVSGRGNGCAPSAINDQGILAGVCETNSAPGWLATVWTAFGTPWALRTRAGAFIQAAGVGPTVEAPAIGYTDSAYASGAGTDGTGWVRSPAGDMRVVPKPTIGGTTYTIASLVVNNLGQAAGVASNPAAPRDCTHAIVSLSAASAVVDLGCGGAFGIDDHGTVVGTVNSRPVIWTAATGLRQLPGLEGGAAKYRETGTAVAINHESQIIGTATMSTGVTHKVLWTLSSEPGSAQTPAATR
ncbi:MAG TPA: hypothetical protein VFA43_05055 [Gemmatimonadaceae bacterium]|nr:hypothetical protein [Gemmatimonadaceae bacterium]